MRRAERDARNVQIIDLVQLGWTQERVGAEVGLTQSQVSRVCSALGVRPPVRERAAVVAPPIAAPDLDGLTASQRAMHAADAWDTAKAPRGAGVRAHRLGAAFGVSSCYVSWARKVLVRDPGLAAAVRAGHVRLWTAFKRVTDRG